MPASRPPEGNLAPAWPWMLGAAVLLALGFALEADPLNGPSYWKWPWRSLPLIRVLMALAPGLILQAWGWFRASGRAAQGLSRQHLASCLALLTAAHLTLLWGAIVADPRSFGLLREIVYSAVATSYFTDAESIVDVGEWLRRFPDQPLHLHASTHPPGPILLYWGLIRLFGREPAAFVGAALIGAASSAGVPLAYRFSRLWARDRRSRLFAAAFYSTIPGLLLFFPEFDQVYPLATMTALLWWAKALKGKAGYGVGVGLALFLATFFAYNLLVLGLPLAVYGVLQVLRAPFKKEALVRGALQALRAVGTWIAAYMALASFLDYPPLASFARALSTQSGLSVDLARPYGSCIVFDLVDFLIIGAGFASLPLLAMHVKRGLSPTDSVLDGDRWPRLSLAIILAIDLTGLLRCETARVWLFLQPLVSASLGLTIARASPVDARCVWVAQAIGLVVLKWKLALIEP